VTIQVYYYYLHHSGDGLYIKATVAIIWLLELFHTLTSLHSTYHLAVLHHANLLENLVEPTVWSLAACVIAGGLLDIIVQSCFLYRLSHFPRMRPIVYFGYFLGVARSAIVIVTAVKTIGISSLTIIETSVVYFQASCATSTGLDFVVAVPMGILLYRREFKLARWNFKRLGFIAIESGTITFIFSLVTLVEVLVSPSHFTWLAALTVLAKIYSNSLMAALNSHHFWEVKVPALTAGPEKKLLPRGLRKRRSTELKDTNGIHIEMTNVTTSMRGYDEGETDHTSQYAGETSSIGELPKHHSHV